MTDENGRWDDAVFDSSLMGLKKRILRERGFVFDDINDLPVVYAWCLDCHKEVKKDEEGETQD